MASAVARTQVARAAVEVAAHSLHIGVRRPATRSALPASPMRSFSKQPAASMSFNTSSLAESSEAIVASAFAASRSSHGQVTRIAAELERGAAAACPAVARLPQHVAWVRMTRRLARQRSPMLCSRGHGALIFLARCLGAVLRQQRAGGECPPRRRRARGLLMVR